MTASIVEGLLESSFVVCLALAYGLLYGTLRVMDLTVATRAAAAGYGGWWLASLLAHTGNPTLNPLVWLAAIGAALVVTFVLWALLAPLTKSAPLVMLVGSLGLSILLQATYQFLFGAAPRVFGAYPVERGIPFLGTSATRLQLISAIYAILALTVVAGIFHLTTFGKRLRTMAQDPEVAQAVFGIDVQRLAWLTVLLASALAAPAALLYCIGHGVSPFSGVQQGLLAFVASIVAGRERPLGSGFVALVLVVATTLAVKTGIVELIAFSLLVRSAGYVVWRYGLHVPPLVRVTFLAGAVLLAARVVTALFEAAGLSQISGVRVPSEFQPLVPYALVAAALLWRPRGVLFTAEERVV
jgi:branched-subunit amino acid ABC-type transport system permease component